MPTVLYAAFTMLLIWLTDMKNRDLDMEWTLYRLGLVAALVAAIICIMVMTAQGAVKDWMQRWSFCPVYRYTGYICMGCGGTRSLRALMSGQLAASILYYPAVPYALFVYLAYMLSHTAALVVAAVQGKGNSRSSAVSRKISCKNTGSGVSGAEGRYSEGCKRFEGLRWRDGYIWAGAALILANFFIKNMIHLLTGTDVMAVLDSWFL